MAWVALGATTACEEPSPEQEIRRRLDEGIDALERNRLSEAASVLAETYADSRKRDKRALKQIAFVVLRRGPVLIGLQNVNVVVNGNAATMTLTALAVQGNVAWNKAADLLPKSGRKLDLTLSWAKLDGEWVVTAIEGEGIPNVAF